MTANEARLQAAFREALELAPDADVTALAFRTIRSWDSVGHMQLIAAIEAAFDLMLDADDVLALTSYATARAIVARHGVAL